MAQGEEVLGRLDGGHGPTPLLDEVDETVGRIERELHERMLGEHMFACKIGSRKRAPRWGPLGGPLCTGGGKVCGA